MKTHKIVMLAAAISAATLLPSLARADNSLVNGEWQVKQAFINTESERTLNYQFNDDRLVGRF